MSKSLFIGFYMAANNLTFGFVPTASEFRCQSIVQEISDGKTVFMTADDGTESPPILLGLCVDPEKRIGE